jgi:thymidylate synthase
MFLGIPFNISFYSLLTITIAYICNLLPKRFVDMFEDFLISINHGEQVREQLSRRSLPLPILKLNRQVSFIDDFKYEEVEVIGCKRDAGRNAAIAV